MSTDKSLFHTIPIPQSQPPCMWSLVSCRSTPLHAEPMPGPVATRAPRLSMKARFGDCTDQMSIHGNWSTGVRFIGHGEWTVMSTPTRFDYIPTS
ncbi:hypothetical protein P152DRAFT_222718 [Eremomyces bilateralis CBS 781.70]|uniref:Uncharacterized protein n=1 Tax=Eremomyces bilateralis CBS 781.70 TaxID=1392243 RepID=A0A6G1FRM6_9PEZI|nr:uncharacterized protein P152DRAFT_222718 [Eremomyces bilateralis CBS 781.70]KAF1808329.1 hypothetical protein P152DRAFT_222718 [Eremomyces bilateralis CBS 781.70]